MSFDRVAVWLGDIVENASNALTYVEGYSFEAFIADRKTVDAVERCVERLAEAVIRIGDERMAIIMPSLKVHEVRGLANHLRHEYDAINMRVFWDTVRSRLPELREACAAELARRTA